MPREPFIEDAKFKAARRDAPLEANNSSLTLAGFHLSTVLNVPPLHFHCRERTKICMT